MKPKSTKEAEIRTPEQNLLACTVNVEENGATKLIFRQKKKEEAVLLDDFLDQVYTCRKTS